MLSSRISWFNVLSSRRGTHSASAIPQSAPRPRLWYAGGAGTVAASIETTRVTSVVKKTTQRMCLGAEGWHGDRWSAEEMMGIII